MNDNTVTIFILNKKKCIYNLPKKLKQIKKMIFALYIHYVYLHYAYLLRITDRKNSLLKNCTFK